MAAPPAPVLATLVLLYATVHAFASALQGVVAAGVGESLPSPSSSATLGRVTALLLLHLRFVCGVAGDSGLPPIWEEVARAKGRIEVIGTLNQTLLRGLPSCQRDFGGGGGRGGALQRLPPTLSVCQERVALELLPGPSLRWGRGFTPCMTRQGTVKDSTCEGADASLLAQRLDGRLALEESMRTPS